MTITLPAEARQYIDGNSPFKALRALADAAERGEIEVSAVAAFAKAQDDDLPFTYQKTRPVSLRIKEYIEANPTVPPLLLVYQGVDLKLWSQDDCDQWQLNYATLSAARKTSAPRGVYLTRNRRTRGKIAKVSDQFVPKVALDIVCSHQLTDGAKLCLQVLMSLAGKTDRVVTFTSSVAKLLGRTPRTVRNHFIQLEAAGLITRTAGSSPNTVQIVINAMVKPEPYKEPRDIAAYKLARRSSDPALRGLAETLTELSWEKHRAAALGQEGGRKKISAFNSESILLNVEAEEATQSDVGQTRQSGPTTHSTFAMSFKTNRNEWNDPRRRLSGQPIPGAGLSSS